jgi:hypothetical protein
MERQKAKPGATPPQPPGRPDPESAPHVWLAGLAGVLVILLLLSVLVS